jgi:glycosyltransferase involved in cell wall biosynthesis
MEVSVIIPTYNSVQYLTAAIESVLEQTFKDYEILVIDDGSTDNTSEAVKCYGEIVRYIYQENGGVSVARNRGIKESKGKYVAFLDADDTWLPNKLERQIETLTCNLEYKFCFSDFLAVSEDLQPLEMKRLRLENSAISDLLLRGNIVGSICTVICERSLFDSVGGFDPKLSQCADWDMWVRLATLTDFLFVDEPLVTYRQHSSNMSKHAPLLEKDSLLVLEKGFASMNVPNEIKAKRRAAFARNYMVLAGTYYHSGQYRDFLRCATRSLRLDIKQLSYLLSFPFRALKVSA